MKQTDLDRAVARATGESVLTIRRLGFLLANPTDSTDPDSDEHGPHVIDWDSLQAQRNAAGMWRPHHEATVA
jgi:hypothetical protein